MLSARITAVLAGWSMLLGLGLMAGAPRDLGGLVSHLGVMVLLHTRHAVYAQVIGIALVLYALLMLPRRPLVVRRHSALLDILPLQKLALALALARGEDPDAPRGLKKVTTTL